MNDVDTGTAGAVEAGAKECESGGASQDAQPGAMSKAGDEDVADAQALSVVKPPRTLQMSLIPGGKTAERLAALA